MTSKSWDNGRGISEKADSWSDGILGYQGLHNKTPDPVSTQLIRPAHNDFTTQLLITSPRSVALTSPSWEQEAPTRHCLGFPACLSQEARDRTQPTLPSPFPPKPHNFSLLGYWVRVIALQVLVRLLVAKEKLQSPMDLALNSLTWGGQERGSGSAPECRFQFSRFRAKPPMSFRHPLPPTQHFLGAS